MFQVPALWSITRHHYGADQRLRVTDKRTYDSTLHTAAHAPEYYLNTFEEYRYDALGRRVLKRAQRAACENYCKSTIERFVWDNADLVHEIRYPGRPRTLDSLEADTGFVTYQFSPCAPAAPCWDTTYTPHYGTVTYGYDGVVDRPIIMYRRFYGRDSTAWGTVVLTPHYNQQGVAAGNTRNAGFFDPSNEVNWPAADARVYGFIASGTAPTTWFGSVLRGGQDATGLQYKRNRYYNATQGRFTQEDPIGLAGGLNLYGYAGGDPVNFSDPFGLCEPRCAEVFQQLAQMAPAMKQMLGGFAAMSVLGGAGVAALTAGGGGAAMTTLSISAGAARVGGAATAVVSGLASKADARQALSGLSLGAEQLKAAGSAISRGTGASTYDLIKQASGDLFVHIYRPGRDGFQVMQSIISPSGGKTVTQYAIDAAGKVLVDPKYP